MTDTYFYSASDAGPFMIRLLRNDYFQCFSHADRISDPDGIYEIESEMTCDYSDDYRDAGDYYWDERTREALRLFAEASPAERAEIFELWG